MLIVTSPAPLVSDDGTGPAPRPEQLDAAHRSDLVDGTRVPLKVADIYCGAGGLSEGFRLAGYEIVFGLDKDEDSVATFRRNHPRAGYYLGSVTDLTPAELAGRIGETDVIVGGPSCQGFSTAGRRRGWVRPDDDRNQLWEHMLALVAEARPRAFLLENVPGLVMWREGQLGEKILAAFRALGYVVEMRILLAADYGVPQRRRRLFLVGILGGAPYEFPAATHMGGWRRDSLVKWEQRRKDAGLLRHIPCWEAIADLPSLGPGDANTRYIEERTSPYGRWLRDGALRVADHESRDLGAEHLSLIEHVPQGGTWRDIPPHLLPDRFRGMRRTDSTNLLGRLDPALPGYTINTQYYNVTTGCYTHPFEDRSLSIREGARLQTFLDTYEFVGTLPSRCRQVGNAVPPLLGAVLAGQLALQLLGNELEEGYEVVASAEASEQLPPPPSSIAVRERMRRQRKADTRPEVRLRSELHRRKLRFRVGVRPLPDLQRTADVLFGGEVKVAVFVDGCFWHGCLLHARPTKSNTKWWADKIRRNRDRDQETSRALEDAGWEVVRVWEHEPPADAATRIAVVVARRREAASCRSTRGRLKSLSQE